MATIRQAPCAACALPKSPPCCTSSKTHVIDIYVFRSYADYTWEFLLKAARKGSEVALLDKSKGWPQRAG